MFKKIPLLIVMVVLALPMLGNVYTVTTIPDPKTQGQDYYVSNPDGVLNQQAVNMLNQNSVDLEKMSEVELCVIAIENYDENDYGDAHSFALDLFNTWGIGKAGNNSGVLLFLASESRDIQIITGGGVEGLLPDITCGQILDENLPYLSEGDFNQGMVMIAQGITNHLVSDEARAELLLGWKPKEDNAGIYNYFIFGFILLIVFAFIGYKRLQGKPGQNRQSIQQQSAGTQTATGCMSWLFPFPMLFFYLYYKNARKNVKSMPLNCTNCGNKMTLIEGDERQQYLSPLQLSEENIGSKMHDVWQCPECQHTDIQSYSGNKSGNYDVCPICGAQAYQTTDRETLQRATYVSAGRRRDTKTCVFCGYVGTAIVVLPMLVHTTSSSSDGGGGYHSSGGGSGSWGGGHSFGGGAGRKF